MVNNVLITAIIRVAIGLVFMHSFVNKVRNIRIFVIQSQNLRYSHPVTAIFWLIPSWQGKLQLLLAH